MFPSAFDRYENQLRVLLSANGKPMSLAISAKLLPLFAPKQCAKFLY